MDDQREIWLPTSEMNVSVRDGEVEITETMTMELRKVKKPAGFAEKERGGVREDDYRS